MLMMLPTVLTDGATWALAELAAFENSAGNASAA